MDAVVGCNSLRGGKRSYGPKTLTANWVEESLGKKAGFSHVRFATTSGGVPTTNYGAGIEVPTAPKNVIFYQN